MRTTLILSAFLAITVSLPAANAQSAASVEKANVSSPAPTCGARGKNGAARCLRRLRTEIAQYCVLRQKTIDRYGPLFAETSELKKTEAACAATPKVGS